MQILTSSLHFADEDSEAQRVSGLAQPPTKSDVEWLLLQGGDPWMTITTLILDLLWSLPYLQQVSEWLFHLPIFSRITFGEFSKGN